MNIVKRQPRILCLDLETSALLSWTWGVYETNVIEVAQTWYILCYAYRWLGEKTKWVGLPDFIGYKPNTCDTKQFIKSLWDLVDEADIIIAQNGDKFDIPKFKTRFIHYNLHPPTPFKTVDTLKVARKFGFPSNKLDNLGLAMGEGRKVKHTGFSLWKGCMAGDKKSWDTMKRYNIQDVDLLARIYKRFLPWISNHPSLAVYCEGRVCPRCQSPNVFKVGMEYNNTMVYQRYRCKECHAPSRGKEGKPVAELR